MSNVIYYIEEKHYSSSFISRELPTETINRLKELSILKKIKNKQGYYKFSFVGIIASESNIIVFLPKYLIYIDSLSEAEKESEIKLVLKVLKKYSRYEDLDDDVSFLSFDSSTENFSLLALVEYIINDYIEYGIYSNETTEYEYNGDGDISWEKTVENELVYSSNKQYIYLNHITDITYSNDNTYISQLHKMILNMSILFMKEISFLELFDFPNLNFNFDENVLGYESFQIKKITNEMSVSFSQRKIRLLNAMKIFIENEKISLSNGYNFSCGTSSFNMVWENVCSDVMQNEIGKDTIPHIPLMPKPVWQKKTPLKVYDPSDTIKPDILRKINNDFFIFDAKYYKPVFNNENLNSGHPGVGDVSKQYLYELAFKNLDCIKYNFFVFPLYNEETKVNGKVEFSLFDGLDLSNIYLLQINTREIFSLYLENTYYQNDFFDNIKRQVY